VCCNGAERGFIMGQPVVHFDVIGKDPDRLRGYYGDLFGWSFDTPSPVAQEVSEPDGYGFVDLVTSEDGSGIRGASEEARATRATPSSTSAFRTWKPRFSERRAPAADV
jgi:predicted enzyme related to lactoylglutathione lyase